MWIVDHWVLVTAAAVIAAIGALIVVEFLDAPLVADEPPSFDDRFYGES